MSASSHRPDSELSQEALLEENRRLKASIAYLEEEIAELKRLIYGSKRERFVPTQKDDAQLSLELEVETTDEEQAVVKQTVSYQKAIKQTDRKSPERRSPVRQSFPDHLPRIDVVLEPEEDLSAMRKIGEEITEELDLEPARLFVRRYIRPRYVSAEESFHIAELPARPIDKGIPGPGLLAQIIVDKFVYHLPFYRQAQRYERLGMKIPSSTLNGWLPAACNLLEPLYLALKFEVLKSTYLQVDETGPRWHRFPCWINKKARLIRGITGYIIHLRRSLYSLIIKRVETEKGPSNCSKIIKAIFRPMGIRLTTSLKIEKILFW